MRSPLRKLAARRPRGPDGTPEGDLRPAPFVVGAARSGTTLLRMMLDAHPQLAVPFETQLLPELIDAAKQPEATPESLAELLVTHRRFGDFGLDPEEMRAAFTSIQPFDLAEAIRSFYRAYAEKQGKPRWGDKSPGYALHIRQIARLLPEAHFVHLIRDGRDVRLSQLARGTNPPSAFKHARRWKRRVNTARRQGRAVGRYMELRYEDLILDTEAELRRICAFVALEFDARMLSYHETAPERLREIDRDLPTGQELAKPRSRPLFKADERLEFHRLTREPPRRDRTEKWRREMPAADIAEFERAAGDLLADLGYELSPGREAPANARR